MLTVAFVFIMVLDSQVLLFAGGLVDRAVFASEYALWLMKGFDEKLPEVSEPETLVTIHGFVESKLLTSRLLLLLLDGFVEEILKVSSLDLSDCLLVREERPSGILFA